MEQTGSGDQSVQHSGVPIAAASSWEIHIPNPDGWEMRRTIDGAGTMKTHYVDSNGKYISDLTPIFEQQLKLWQAVNNGFMPEGAECLSCVHCSSPGPGNKRCMGCKKVRYCSKECQRKHWKEHEALCKASGSTQEVPKGREAQTAGQPAGTIFTFYDMRKDRSKLVYYGGK